MISFSPCKNATADAATKSPPACALSAEADQYAHCTRCYGGAGVASKQSMPEEWGGVAVDNLRPAIVLLPSFATSLKVLKNRIPAPSSSPTERSTLILEGDVTVKSLQLDGGLVVRCAPGAVLRHRALRRRERGPGGARRRRRSRATAESAATSRSRAATCRRSTLRAAPGS